MRFDMYRCRNFHVEILDSQVRKGDQPVLFCNGSDIFLVLVRVINQKLWYLR